MKKKYFGKYGGSFVSPEMQKELDLIESEFYRLIKDKKFNDELKNLQKTFLGRPTPLYFCEKLSTKIGGAKIYLKREDLNHTGAHKINHCIGEALLAKYLGKKKIIAETGAGQHGLAIATVCALMDLECEVHMGCVDVEKQKVNVDKMKLLGAKIVSVTSGNGTLKDAVDSALSAYEKDFKNSIYCIGSVVGPYPYPVIVRHFQSVIGKESKKQIKAFEKRLPDYVVACVGGGSNAIGIFSSYLNNKEVNLVGVEALGNGAEIGKNSATIKYGKTEIYQGFKTKVLLDENDNVAEAYSIASGLDYPAVGPEHAYLSDIKRVEYVTINDKEAVDAFFELTKTEGIIPALESSHAVAYGIKLAKKLPSDKIIIVNLSGRGDKDIEFILNNIGLSNWKVP